MASSHGTRDAGAPSWPSRAFRTIGLPGGTLRHGAAYPRAGPPWALMTAGALPGPIADVHARPSRDVAAAFDVDPAAGLSSGIAEQRYILAGPERTPGGAPPVAAAHRVGQLHRTVHPAAGRRRRPRRRPRRGARRRVRAADDRAHGGRGRHHRVPRRTGPRGAAGRGRSHGPRQARRRRRGDPGRAAGSRRRGAAPRGRRRPGRPAADPDRGPRLRPERPHRRIAAGARTRGRGPGRRAPGRTACRCIRRHERRRGQGRGHRRRDRAADGVRADLELPRRAGSAAFAAAARARPPGPHPACRGDRPDRGHHGAGLPAGQSGGGQPDGRHLRGDRLDPRGAPGPLRRDPRAGCVPVAAPRGAGAAPERRRRPWARWT